MMFNSDRVYLTLKFGKSTRECSITLNIYSYSCAEHQPSPSPFLFNTDLYAATGFAYVHRSSTTKKCLIYFAYTETSALSNLRSLQRRATTICDRKTHTQTALDWTKQQKKEKKITITTGVQLQPVLKEEKKAQPVNWLKLRIKCCGVHSNV